MKKLLCPIFAVMALASLIGRVSAVEVQIPVDTNSSTLRVDLCVGAIPPERCDDETHPLQGSLVVDLDDGGNPTSVSLRNFDLQSTAAYVLRIDYGLILGRIDVTASNLRIYHALPGPANPYVPVATNQVNFQDVPYLTAGAAAYNISGLACTVIGASFPCTSNIDLSTLGQNSVTNLPGTLQVSNGMVHISMDLQFSTPLNPDDPTLGRLAGHAVIHGSAPINEPPSVALLSPTNGAVFAAGRPVLLEAQASDDSGPVPLVEFFSGTNKIGQVTQAPYTFLWANPTSAVHTVTARATDSAGASAVSAPASINVGVFAMVPFGSVWKYLDDGSNPGTAWRAKLFADGAWPSGPGELGYGDDVEGRPEATVVGFGSDPAQKHITTYFRRSWVVPDRSLITGLTLRLLRDDGAVVYFNGFEAFRNNMTNNPVFYTNLAAAAIAGADETNLVVTAVGLIALLQGTNTLAVEVHQNSPGSSDLSFDLELLAATRFQSAPSLWIQSDNSQTHVIGWPSWAVGYQLQGTPSLGASASWQPVTDHANDDGTWKTLRMATGAGNRFFRLRAD